MTYQIFDTELDIISILSGAVTALFSLGAFFLATVVNVVVGYALADAVVKQSPLASVLLRGSLVLAAVALVFFILGIIAFCKKQTLINKIKSETIVQRTGGNPA